jgi:hypothetical protein
MMDISEADDEAKKRKRRVKMAVAMVAMFEGDGLCSQRKGNEKRREWWTVSCRGRRSRVYIENELLIKKGKRKKIKINKNYLV